MFPGASLGLCLCGPCRPSPAPLANWLCFWAPFGASGGRLASVWVSRPYHLLRPVPHLPPRPWPLGLVSGRPLGGLWRAAGLGLAPQTISSVAARAAPPPRPWLLDLVSGRPLGACGVRLASAWVASKSSRGALQAGAPSTVHDTRSLAQCQRKQLCARSRQTNMWTRSTHGLAHKV